VAQHFRSDLKCLTVEVSRPHTIRHKHTQTHTHTHPIGLLWRWYQLVTITASYTICNIHKRRTSMSWAGFELAIPATKVSQAYALDRTAIWLYNYCYLVWVLRKSGPTSYCVLTVLLLSYGGIKFPQPNFRRRNGIVILQDFIDSRVTKILKPVSYIEMYILFWRDSAPVGQDLLITKVSRLHTTTHHSR